MLGGEFNCTFSTLHKKGGRPIDSKKASLDELQSLIKTHRLLNSWRFKNPDQPGVTWANTSMKIQCRLDYFFISKQLKDRVKECKIVPAKHLFRSLRRRSFRVFSIKVSFLEDQGSGNLTTLCFQILITWNC